MAPPRQRDGARHLPMHPPGPLQPGPHVKGRHDRPAAVASSDPDGEAPDRPLTLAVLRRLVRANWSRLPGDTLVVLSRDAEGNLFSPFSTYSLSRYAPTHSDLVG